MSEDRPDPDQLLARVRADEARQARGKLKIFFGAAAGVGKTYAMLEAARAQQAAGVDVVIGWVETHGRAETEALLPGLEQLPPRTLEYRGATLREFDLDAALARRPSPDPRRRARPYQRPRLPPRQALAGRHGAPRRRDRRLHHPERPASREPERRRGARDGGANAGDGPRLDLGGGGRGRAGGSPAGRPDPAPEGGEGLPPRAGRGGRTPLLPQGQSHRAPGAGAPDHRGARRRPDGGLSARSRRARDLARGRAHPGLRQPQPLRLPRRPREPDGWPRGCGPSGWS